MAIGWLGILFFEDLETILIEVKEIKGGERRGAHGLGKAIGELQIDFMNFRGLPPALQGLMILPAYQVMGIVGLWLTFESDGWHFDSCLRESGDFEKGEWGDL